MSLSPRPIAAISTALQDAAIGVLRLSGPGSHEVALRCFRPLSGKAPKPRRACVGRVFDAQGDIDLAVLTLWAAPASFTGEDMAEFSCHGGRVVLYDVLAALLEAGRCAPGWWRPTPTFWPMSTFPTRAWCRQTPPSCAPPCARPRRGLTPCWPPAAGAAW